MKTPFVIALGAVLVGCASSPPKTSLSAEQATTLAIQLANAKAQAMYHRQPFGDGQPAALESGHWVWRQLAPGDLEAEVELAADSSTNAVSLFILSDIINRPTPAGGRAF
jgi:hypothetical protein